MSTLFHAEGAKICDINRMQNERKDAIRNRAELLAAAESAVAVHGVDVAFNLIARLAGVGQGTLYRHFPNREALIQALLERSMDNLECFAAQQSGDDAMFRVLEFYASQIEKHFALATCCGVVDPNHIGFIAARRRFADMMSPLLQRAIDAGLCKPAVTIIDIGSLIAMLTALRSGTSGETSVSSPQRMLTLMLEGMRRI
ncbi:MULTISPECIES: TetR/AcrR family transcriptional regulator [Pantoea]|uniref:TetR/AcrR family transcriptional regulator n=1 Tax=Pantoea TaxID=53335 RepID=UPI00230382CA